METAAIEIRDEARGCRIRLRVRAGGRADAILGAHGGALKISVTAPPERGKANSAVETLVAGVLGFPPARVTVIAGHGSPSKTLLVQGLDASAVRSRLAVL